ncbi:hypothetical protein FN846DRAFT_885697 [Sphaerosporella brunnea]|uniref:Uncharacterized protein n=1 Tax=Sphaerosporella brunnea TaxID=1250544 RepID=A0A5J5FBT9_9PEZI|nr:hypothetical protein FN846DRAFT_885697 [Sphaerosporella brunnea]
MSSSSNQSPRPHNGTIQVELDSAEFAQFQQFRAAMLSEQQPIPVTGTEEPLVPTSTQVPHKLPLLLPQLSQTPQAVSPSQSETNIFLSVAQDTTNPGRKPEDASWHWTNTRALNASMGVHPEDRSAVQLCRQEVRDYLGRFGKQLNVAWTKWDPEEWVAMECTAAKEFAARRGWTRKTTAGIMKSLCEVNHRNEEQARRKAAGIVPTPRVLRSEGVKQRRSTVKKGPPLRRPNRTTQFSTGGPTTPTQPHKCINSTLPASAQDVSLPSQADIHSPLPVSALAVTTLPQASVLAASQPLPTDMTSPLSHPASPIAAPIACDASAVISTPKKRGRPRKEVAAAAITASIAGGLVDASQIADIAATNTACDDAGTTQNGLRRSGRKKGFAAKTSDNAYQQAEKTLINSLAAANKDCRTAREAFHHAMGFENDNGCASGGF